MGNRLTQTVDSVGGTLNRTYDLLDRAASETTAGGTVSYTYDAAGHPATTTAPGQAQVTYSHNDANWLTGVTQGSAAATIAYEAAWRRIAATLPGGVAGSYVYDNASELTGITYANDTTTLGTLTYGYDAAGWITSRGGTLFNSVLPASSSAIYDIANRMTSRRSAGVTVTPVWDKDGELTSDGSRTYGWDARGRLTSISGVASYLYDPSRRRSIVTPISGAATAYLYDGPAII